VPSTILRKLARATDLVDQATEKTPKKARHLRKRAGVVLKSAGRQAITAAKGRHPKLSHPCAAVLRGATDLVRRDLRM